jgi:hypothetical protein
MNDEEILIGGVVNSVTRCGDVVYRTGGPWVPAVHLVLSHLRQNSFHWAPEAIGIDLSGREMISFLPGESMMRPWRAVMFTDDALIQSAIMLRALHDSTSNLELPPETIWRTGPAPKTSAQVVRHGDLGPWNTLWQEDRLTGLIDWDFAEPGLAITDVAQMALYFVPLRGEAHWRECGFPSRPNFAHRLDVLCNAYGPISPTEVIREIERLQVVEIHRMEDFASQGLYPWTMFRDKGDIERTREEVEWLRTVFPTEMGNGINPGASNST